MPSPTLTPADAGPTSWVDRAPAAAQPYLRLMRADRPVGFWLLMWPCLWSTALALSPSDGTFWRLSGLFLVGSIAMRGAGCTWNDIADRRIDAQVARTAGRPLAAGLISVKQALAFAVGLSLLGLVVLLSLGSVFAIWLGIASLLPVALYPFAKRVTDWPQAVLGLTFNWGALMGWAAVYDSLAWPPVLLYLGAIFWTLGYDTIYAHMDKQDDAIVGVRSSALALGDRTRPAVSIFYLIFLLCAAAALTAQFGNQWGALALVPAAVHLAGQVRRTDIGDPATCLAIFKSNHAAGALVFAGIVAARYIAL